MNYPFEEPSSSNNCPVSREVDFDDDFLSSVRPVSQSPDLLVQECDDDDSFDDEENNYETCQQFPFSMQKYLNAPVGPDANYLASSSNEENNYYHKPNNQEKKEQFDEFLSSTFNADIQTIKNLRQSRLNKYLSAPVSSFQPPNNEEENSYQNLLLSAPVVYQTNNNDVSIHNNNSSIVTRPKYTLPPSSTVKIPQPNSGRVLKPSTTTVRYRPERVLLTPEPVLPPPVGLSLQFLPSSQPFRSISLPQPQPNIGRRSSVADSSTSTSSSSMVRRSEVPSESLSMTVSSSKMRVQREFHKKLTSAKSKKHKFIDTHCHLDMLFTKYNFNSDFKSFKNKYKSTWSPNFVGCITDFCCPATYSNDSNFFEQILEVI